GAARCSGYCCARRPWLHTPVPRRSASRCRFVRSQPEPLRVAQDRPLTFHIPDGTGAKRRWLVAKAPGDLPKVLGSIPSSFVQGLVRLLIAREETFADRTYAL